MAKSNPFQFIEQVRSEIAKVTWPTRRDTVVTSIMVFIMVIAAALFFLLVDSTIGWLVGVILGYG